MNLNASVPISQQLRPPGTTCIPESEWSRGSREQEIGLVVNSTDDSARSTPPPKWPSRVAVVHEWHSTYARSERVLEQMLTVFLDADLFV
jgi:hypothetical protein